jgi:D-aspartate ligase
VLLASGSAGGTIAAARHLGAIGVVRVISSKLLSAAAWSRYVFRSYRVAAQGRKPPMSRSLACGTVAPGQILLPTSDQTAWLYTGQRPSQLALSRLSTVDREHAGHPRQKLFAQTAIAAGLAVLPS